VQRVTIRGTRIFNWYYQEVFYFPKKFVDYTPQQETKFDILHSMIEFSFWTKGSDKFYFVCFTNYHYVSPSENSQSQVYMSDVINSVMWDPKLLNPMMMSVLRDPKLLSPMLMSPVFKNPRLKILFN
jgi:hypothetical protein